jgi:hypothetical protein
MDKAAYTSLPTSTKTDAIHSVWKITLSQTGNGYTCSISSVKHAADIE